MKFLTFIFTAFVLMTPDVALAQKADSEQRSSAENREMQFFSVIPDVPILEGVQEIEEQSLVFDKAEGRFVEIIARIENRPEGEVLYDYIRILPQFGWAKTSKNQFAREDETLSLNVEKTENQSFLKVTVSPKH